MVNRAELAILLIGTSNFRIVHDDFHYVEQWLVKNSNRVFGLLFLNPYSPHAFRRERPDVHRSMEENIIKSLKESEKLAKLNANLIASVYDGPYRYSARAIDPYTEHASSEIHIFTSTHTRGTSGGFHITLPRSKRDPFGFFKQELLALWQTALTNPAGHGVSRVAYQIIELVKLKDSIESLILDSITDVVATLQLYDDRQLHLTLSSLCRTQSSHSAGPLRIGQSEEHVSLPSHFGAFLCDVIDETFSLPDTNETMVMDTLELDDRGYVSITSSTQRSDGFNHYNSFLAKIAELVENYSKRYPEEGWDVEIREYKRFGPKFLKFEPHVTVGMLFNKRYPLPLPLKGRTASVTLPRPIAVKIRELRLVHYAYRSLLRCAGELPLIRKKRKYQTREMLQNLGIQNECV